MPTWNPTLKPVSRDIKLAKPFQHKIFLPSGYSLCTFKCGYCLPPFPSNFIGMGKQKNQRNTTVITAVAERVSSARAISRTVKKWQNATFITSFWFCVISRWEIWEDRKPHSGKTDVIRRGENWVISEKPVVKFCLIFSRTVRKKGKNKIIVN